MQELNKVISRVRPLYNGICMPQMVMSTISENYKSLKNNISAGIACGFRAFDTARDYGNEKTVGRVIFDVLKEQKMSRKDIFITTKIGNSQQVKGDIERQIDISLKNLEVDYLDLWLMHWPYPGYFVDTWKKMEKVYASGKVKSIGVANFSERHFKTLFDAGVELLPMVTQFEFHPLRTVPSLVRFCQEKNIKIQSYSPLCCMIPQIKESPILQNLAQKYEKTIPQIILRWHVQQNIVPVFNSSKPERLVSNFQIWNFYLKQEDMNLISSLDQNFKYHLESCSCVGY